VPVPRVLVGVLVFVVIVLAGVLVIRDREPALEAGWTGLTEPEEVIEARRVLMIQIEQLMRPIDQYTADGDGDLAALRSAAATIEAMLLAFPHLFPPATNQFDAEVREPPTYTLPALWDDFGRFLTFNEAAEHAAATMAASEDPEAFRAAGRSLRASCDGCHAAFTRPYTPPTVTREDLDFDFDSMFPGN
jgi:cytochrome c556